MNTKERWEHVTRVEYEISKEEVWMYVEKEDGTTEHIGPYSPTKQLGCYYPRFTLLTPDLSYAEYQFSDATVKIEWMTGTRGEGYYISAWQELTRIPGLRKNRVVITY